MNIHDNEAGRGHQTDALSVWENEGGAHGPDSMDHQYGRRIERDRSWTVYHVFTGIPARASGEKLTGLNRSNATDRMLSLNNRNERRRSERDGHGPRAVRMTDNGSRQS